MKDGAGNWSRQRFRVDSATDVTTFPAFEAKRLGLPFPQQAARGAAHSQTGLEIRSGYLRFRLDWFRIALDKDPSVGAPHGEMILEKK